MVLFYARWQGMTSVKNSVLLQHDGSFFVARVPFALLKVKPGPGLLIDHFSVGVGEVGQILGLNGVLAFQPCY